MKKKVISKKLQKLPPTKEHVEIGARIMAAIEASRFKNVKTFAEELGRTQDTVYKMCSGDGVGQFAHLSKICHLLGVTPNEILGFNSSEETSALIDGFVGALEEAAGLSEDESRVLAQGVLALTKEPVVRSADRGTILRDRGASEARRLSRAKMS